MAVLMGYEKDHDKRCTACGSKSGKTLKYGIGPNNQMIVFNLCGECSHTLLTKLIKAGKDW